MAGEIWRSSSAAAKEVTPGTAVQPATIKLYWPEPSLTVAKAPTVHRSASGRRDSIFAVTFGPKEATGTTGPIPTSAEESLELCSMGISATPVITTPATGVLTRLHTYKPGDLQSATIEWFDGKRGWIGAGQKLNTLTFAGDITGEKTMTGELFGTDVVAGTVTATPPLVERDPTFMQPFQGRLFVDGFGGTPGTTEMPGTLMNYSVQIQNNLSRVYTYDNTQAANRVIAGNLDVSASMTFDADSAFSIAEFNNWVDGVKRVVRLELQDETGFIETTLRRFITIDIPGIWTAVDLSGNNQGVRTYSLTFQSIYSATLAAMLQVRVQAAKLLAFAP